MDHPFPPDIQQCLTAWVASGNYASADEALRDALRALAAEQADFNAVEEALAELDAGDPGVPLSEAFNDLRARHGIAPEA